MSPLSTVSVGRHGIPSVIPPCRAIGRRGALACVGAWLLTGSLPALALGKPTGEVVLTVRGSVRKPNDGTLAQFDMSMLEALPQSSFSTRTPWYAQPRRFTGPLLRDVLDAAGAEGSVLRLTALNDYRVDMPFDDVRRHDVMLARLLDDRPMAVRDKGPLFVIYPFDAQPELRRATYYSRAAWQLRIIEVM
jgi:hypothetical protein